MKSNVNISGGRTDADTYGMFIPLGNALASSRTGADAEHVIFQQSAIGVGPAHFFAPIEIGKTEIVWIGTPVGGNRAKSWMPFAGRAAADPKQTSLDAYQCFPFYVYDAQGGTRRENMTDWALDEFRNHYKDPVISKWSIFDYVYGVLHHPAYRATYAAELKRDLPRIPFAREFRTFQRAGQDLIQLHLEYDKLEPWELKRIETPVSASSPGGRKVKAGKDKTTIAVTDSLTLGGLPPEAFDYRLGRCSALEWALDSNPLQGDNKNLPAIMRHIGQIVRASVETMKIVKGLPTEFS